MEKVVSTQQVSTQMSTQPVWNRDGITIYHGDGIELMKSLPDKSIDFVFTDPPYGHNNNDGGDLIHRREAALGRGPAGKPRPIATDGEGANDLVRSAFREWNRILNPGCCCCCCCGGGGPDPQFARWSLWLDEALGFKHMVIWDKGPIGMGWHYRRSYETLLIGEKPGAKCKWYDTTNRIENVIRPGDYGIKKLIPGVDDHPTEKPIALVKHFLKLHTQKGDLVLDPFLGSGTTAIACLETGRKFIGADLDKEHIDTAILRLKNAEGNNTLFDLKKLKKLKGRKKR